MEPNTTPEVESKPIMGSNTTPEAESKPKPDSKPFPVITLLNVLGFYMSSYLGLSAKIVEPRKVDVDNADKYEEDAVFFHAPEMLKELLRIEPGLKTDANQKEKDWRRITLDNWFTLGKTQKLIRALKSRSETRRSANTVENEAKTEEVDENDRSGVVLVITAGPNDLRGSYLHHKLVLWLVLYVSETLYLKVDDHVHYINSKAIELSLQGKEEELEEFKEVVGYDKLKFDELKLENEQLKAKNTDLSTKLEIVIEGRSVFVDLSFSKTEQIAFIEFRNRTKDCPDFQVVRGQIYYASRQIKLARDKTITINRSRLGRRNAPPPTIKNEVYVTRHDVPNAVNIWNRIKIALEDKNVINSIDNADLKFVFVKPKVFGMDHLLDIMEKAINRRRIIP